MTAPQTLGPFRVLGLLGQGASSSVYEVEREGARYALKLPLPEVSLSPRGLERLRREATIAASLDHPHLVRLVEWGELPLEGPYLLYELVEGGQTLAEAWREATLEGRLLQLHQVALGLGHAHGAGVVHRDLKPRNVLVEPGGAVRVTDFGAAWSRPEGAQGETKRPDLTRTGDIVGTPSYTAPEVLLHGARSPSPQVDVWGLGLLLHEALTGQHLFAGCSLSEVLEATKAGIPPPEASPPLARLCLDALAFDLARRPASGTEFAERLQAACPALAAPVAKSRPEPARGFEGYELLEELGRGGMGVVYRARHAGLGREVALKVLDLRDPRRRERFEREAEAASRVTHPNLVRVHDAGWEGARGYLAMELVHGESLEGAGPFPPARVAEIGVQLARALGALHGQGVVHRDVKPGNVLLDEAGQVRLTDFGVAWLDDAERLTKTGAAVGTPLYMSPEQFLGRPVDTRSDVYCLGGTLYFLLTGKAPTHEARGLAEILEAKRRLPPPPSSVGAPDSSLDAVCLRALAPEPEDRYPSAAALAADLEQVLGGEERAATIGPRLVVAVALAVALGVVALAIGTLPRAGAGPSSKHLAAIAAALSAPSAAQGAAELRALDVQRVLERHPEGEPLPEDLRDAQALLALADLLGGGQLEPARAALGEGPPRSAPRASLAGAIAALDTSLSPSRAARAVARAQQLGGVAGKQPYAELEALAAIARARGRPSSSVDTGALSADLASLEDAKGVALCWRSPALCELQLRLGRPRAAVRALWAGAPGAYASGLRERAGRALLEGGDLDGVLEIARGGALAGGEGGSVEAEVCARLVGFLRRYDASPFRPTPQRSHELAALVRIRSALRPNARELAGEKSSWGLVASRAILGEPLSGGDLAMSLAEAYRDRPSDLVDFIVLWVGTERMARTYLDLVEGALEGATPEHRRALELRRLHLLLRLGRFEKVRELGAELLGRLSDRRERAEATQFMADALLRLKRFEETLELLEPYPGANHTRALAYVGLGRHEEGIAEAKGRIRQAGLVADDPCLVSAEAAWLAYSHGGPPLAPAAREVLELYLELRGGKLVALAWLACMQWDCGDQEAAVASLERLRQATGSPSPSEIATLTQGGAASRNRLLLWAQSIEARSRVR